MILPPFIGASASYGGSPGGVVQPAIGTDTLRLVPRASRGQERVAGGETRRGGRGVVSGRGWLGIAPARLSDPVPRPDFGFTPRELRTRRALRSPRGVQRALDALPYHLAGTAWSPRGVLSSVPIGSRSSLGTDSF